MFESRANASLAYRVRFDDEVLVFPHNQTDAGAYNFTTGRYVCPQDGKYELTVMVGPHVTTKSTYISCVRLSCAAYRKVKILHHMGHPLLSSFACVVNTELLTFCVNSGQRYQQRQRQSYKLRPSATSQRMYPSHPPQTGITEGICNPQMLHRYRCSMR